MDDIERHRAALSALAETAFLLERAHAQARRAQAFRRAQQVVAAIPTEEFVDRWRSRTFQELSGVGSSTGAVIEAAADGQESDYLLRAREAAPPDPGGGEQLLAALKGDLHSHSDWSDGGTPIVDMAETARALGHEYLALTDHSPRLTVANGLSRERLERQLDVVADLNDRWDDFRLLTGIEVDILDDGALDQDQDLLAELDVVVASVHSKLRMPGREMTPRMVNAIQNPVVTVLGHCTGRMATGTGEKRRVRPPSEFDAEIVFAACERFEVAVEINSRPERRDPPRDLIALAREIGCRFSIDTDAHAPGQLAWLPFGCARAAEMGVTPAEVINSTPVERLLAGTRQSVQRAPRASSPR